MKVSTILIRNTIALIVLIAGTILSFSAIIALPLLEEEVNYKKDDFYALNDRIDEQRDQTLAYLQTIVLDSGTQLKLKYITKTIGNPENLEPNSTRFSLNKKNIVENIKDQASKCKQLYVNTGVLSKIQKDAYASQLMLSYTNLCMETKQQVFVTFQGILLQTDALYSIALADKSQSYSFTRKQKKILDNAFFDLKPLHIQEPERLEASSMGFFFPANWALNARSQNLAIITGLMGFALFGAVLGAFSKASFNNVNTDKIRTDGLIYYEMLVVLVRGFSAALVVYLSLKGGLSLITTTSSDKINPYVILFLCFISAVFSDNIWEWAKGKLVSDDEKIKAKDIMQDESHAASEEVEDPGTRTSLYTNVKTNIGTEIPAELPLPEIETASTTLIHVDEVRDIPDSILQEALQTKYPEWKETFSLLSASIGEKMTNDGSNVKALHFRISKEYLDDPLFCSELPEFIIYLGKDNVSYDIPILVSTP